MKQLSKLAVLVAIIALTLTLYAKPTTPAPPQGGEAPKNLKIFPKDITRERLLGTMQNFTRALGVKCDHCHVQGDFASDEKPDKDVARAMMKMMANLRQNADEFLPGGRAQKVSCWTCHRGSAHIEQPAPPQPPPGGGQAPSRPPGL
jgi:hypothetical protein